MSKNSKVGEKSKVKWTEKNVVHIKERGLYYNPIEVHMRRFEGEILTIIDAAIADDRHNKAIKDLVRRSFRAKILHFFELCHPGIQCASQHQLDEINDKIGRGEIIIEDCVEVVKESIK